jgi:hypothetical protein
VCNTGLGGVRVGVSGAARVEAEQDDFLVPLAGASSNPRIQEEIARLHELMNPKGSASGQVPSGPEAPPSENHTAEQDGDRPTCTA